MKLLRLLGNANKKLINNKVLGIAILAVLMSSGIVTSFAATQSIQRISGNDRFETSLYVTDFHKSDTAIVVNGYVYPDALSSITLANKYKANVVLSNNSLEKYQQREFVTNLKNRNVKTVYIIGGKASISDELEKELRKFFSVERISGGDRYETSLKVVEMSGYRDIIVTSGNNYPDALSTSSLVSKTKSGLLLVDGKKDNAIPSTLNPIYTVGGENSVKKAFGERISGKDRYETCYKILEKVSPKTLVVASGSNFPDALSASSFAGVDSVGVILCRPRLDKELVARVKGVEKLYLVGGLNSVSGLTINSIINLYSSDYRANIRPKRASETNDKFTLTNGEDYLGWYVESSKQFNNYNWYYFNDNGYMIKNSMKEGWSFDYKGIATLTEDSIKNLAFNFYKNTYDGEKNIDKFNIIKNENGKYHYEYINDDGKKDEVIVYMEDNMLIGEKEGLKYIVFDPQKVGFDKLKYYSETLGLLYKRY